MSTGRMIRTFVLFAVVGGMGGYLNHLRLDLGQARGDLLLRTRFLIRQARDADVETKQRLFARYWLPGGDPAQQKAQFERLWSVLHECEPGSVAYASRADVATEGGGAPPRRQVLLQRKDRQGKPATLRLEWVQMDGTWYIGDCAL
jgi:hypothetical protein